MVYVKFIIYFIKKDNVKFICYASLYSEPLCIDITLLFSNINKLYFFTFQNY